MGSPQTNVHASMQHISAATEPIALTLDPSGLIKDCSDASEELFGLNRNDLILHHISILFPQLSKVELMSEGRFNMRLNFLAHCGHLFWAQDRDGEVFMSELFFSQLGYGVNPILKLIVRPCESVHS